MENKGYTEVPMPQVPGLKGKAYIKDSFFILDGGITKDEDGRVFRHVSASNKIRAVEKEDIAILVKDFGFDDPIIKTMPSGVVHIIEGVRES